MSDESDQLRQRIKAMQEGFEGCCPCCEPVGVLNRRLQAENEMLRRHVRSIQSKALDELARLDEELGLIPPPTDHGFLQDRG